MYLPIARKYRPNTFSEVFGQHVSCTIMRNSIHMDRIIKSMLISGIRGTGKTTLARIYGKSLNCEKFKELNDACGSCNSCLEALNGSHPDILEFDAASHNGVDFVRDLEIIVTQIPVYKHKLIIFDEAHMFTKQAQEALLKILEESCDNVGFILVTTNPEGLIDTVRSRCLSMPLRPITIADVEDNIRYILNKENLEYEESFVSTLGRLGGGSLRDVQQILDQCILAAGSIKLDSTYLESSVGLVSVDQYKKLAPVICALDPKLSLDSINTWYMDGMDLELLFVEGIPNLLRDFSIILANGYSTNLTLLTGIPYEVMRNKLTLSYDQIKIIIEQWEVYISMMKTSSNPKLVWELFLIKICEVKQCT